MEKRKIMHVSFWIFAILLLCTVVSFRIQELMRNEVTVLSPEKEERFNRLSFPVKCLSESSDGLLGVWKVVREEGAMGEEIKVRFYNPLIISKDDKTVMVENEGEELLIVDYFAYPLDEGMVVEVISNKPDALEMESKMKEQKKNLYQLAFFAGIFLILTVLADRLLNGFFQKKPWHGIFGIAVLIAAAFMVYQAMGKLDIPREYLPEEQIFDISFYKEKFGDV